MNIGYQIFDTISFHHFSREAVQFWWVDATRQLVWSQTCTSLVGLYTKGGCNKKWTERSNTKFSVNIGLTETYYLPKQWKLNENFAELCRLKIAALIG